MTRLTCFCLLLVLAFSIHCQAQTIGDYRSAVGFLELGTWDDLDDWERWSGGAWVAPNAVQGYPGENSVPNLVTILSGDLMELNVSPANNIGNLTIEDLSSLTTSGDPTLTINNALDFGISIFVFDGTGNLTVSGTSQMDGVFSDTDGTGSTLFVGAITNTGVWSTTAITTSANMTFRGGIANSGTFAAGGATFNTNNQTLSGTGSFSFTNTVNVTGVTVTNNASVTMSNTAAGTLAGTGTWSQGTGTLNYAGATITVTTFSASAAGNTVQYNSSSVAQTIRVPSTTYEILTLNNTSGTSPQLTAGGNLTVSSTLNMTSGIVNLAGNTFTLGSSGVASDLNRTASTTTNWMYGGTFTRFWLNATAVSSTAAELYGLFPVGASTASSYRPVAINSTSNPTATGSFSVIHINSPNATDLGPVYNDAGTNIVRKHDAQFVTSSSGVTGGTYNISVTMTGLLAGTLSDIRLAVSNGAFTVTNVGTHAAATGTAQNPTATRTGVTPVGNLVGDFRITTTNSTATPLPIILQYFRAHIEGDKVITEWKTSQEFDNDFFTVQKTIDFESFEDIGVLSGMGTSREPHSYSLTDKYPLPGKSYYRLKQTDFDGNFTFSKPVMVNYAGPISAVLEVWPNPLDGRNLSIRVYGLKPSDSVPLQIFNQQGIKVLDITITGGDAGIAEKLIVLDQKLSTGLYIVKAGQTLQLTRKLVVD